MKIYVKTCMKAAIKITALVYMASVSNAVFAEEKQVKKSTYVIETQVQGSQEQPNVIYITPWQDNKNTVNIDKTNLPISLPQLTAVNPKKFKQTLRTYHQQNQTK